MERRSPSHRHRRRRSKRLRPRARLLRLARELHNGAGGSPFEPSVLGEGLLSAGKMSLDGVVGGVNLCGQPLGALSLLGVSETVRVVTLHELTTLPVRLFQRATGPQTQPVVSGEHLRWVLSRCVGLRGGPPPRLRPDLRPTGASARGVWSSESLFGGTFFVGGAPLLSGTLPGSPEGISQGLAALAAGTYGLS